MADVGSSERENFDFEDILSPPGMEHDDDDDDDLPFVEWKWRRMFTMSLQITEPSKSLVLSK